jgi:hypothetical protein
VVNWKSHFETYNFMTDVRPLNELKSGFEDTEKGGKVVIDSGGDLVT